MAKLAERAGGKVGDAIVNDPEFEGMLKNMDRLILRLQIIIDRIGKNGFEVTLDEDIPLIGGKKIKITIG